MPWFWFRWSLSKEKLDGIWYGNAKQTINRNWHSCVWKKRLKLFAASASIRLDGGETAGGGESIAPRVQWPARRAARRTIDEMSTNTFVYPRKMLRRFLTMYRELPCLWDKTCVGYKQKQKRHEAISKLTALVKEWDPTATRVHVLRKIESLRSCVRREHKRVQDSKRKARSEEEVYTPHLWYYDMLSFVFDGDAGNRKLKTSTACDEVSSETVVNGVCLMSNNWFILEINK